MVTLIDSNRRRLGDIETVVEDYRGVSGDTKPVLLANRNGSTFYEIDTGNVFMYDGGSLAWKPQ